MSRRGKKNRNIPSSNRFQARASTRPPWAASFLQRDSYLSRSWNSRFSGAERSKHEYIDSGDPLTRDINAQLHKQRERGRKKRIERLLQYMYTIHRMKKITTKFTNNQQQAYTMQNRDKMTEKTNSTVGFSFDFRTTLSNSDEARIFTSWTVLIRWRRAINGNLTKSCRSKQPSAARQISPDEETRVFNDSIAATSIGSPTVLLSPPPRRETAWQPERTREAGEDEIRCS